MPKFKALERSLPPGYHFEIGGEYEEQMSGFMDLTMVMGLSVGMIFIALVMQFRHAIKPLVVFAAIPYGFAGALATLWMNGSPFGFMAFLGIVSLVGVIVSHIIVLFDFIEEMHAHGKPLEEALLERRHRQAAAGDDHGGRDRDRAVSAGGSRRPAVGADVLRADWRPDGGHLCDADRGARALRDLRARPEDHLVGRGALMETGQSRSRTIERNGVRLSYSVEGEGPPLLLIQGVGLPGRGWLPQVVGLRKRFTVITFDNRGVGASDGGPIR